MIEPTLFRKIKKCIPIPSTSIIIFAGQMVLLLLRNINPDKGKWSLPGGRIELGETPIDTAKRELFEETGLSTELHELRSAPFFHSERQDIAIVYWGQIEAPRKLKLNYESTNSVWLKPEDIPTCTAESVRELVAEAWEARNELQG